MSTTAQGIPSGEALRLFIDRDKDGQVDATAGVRWCISPDVVAMIKQKAIRKPKLVIVVEHEGKEQDRYVVPLEAEMRFIQFRSPGKNTVHATVMWDGRKKVDDALKAIFGLELLKSGKPGHEAVDKQYRELNHQIWELEEAGKEAASTQLVVLRAEREGLLTQMENLSETEDAITRLIPENEWSGIHRLDEEVAVDVIVEKELFAKEPPRWMKWLGNLHNWGAPARDQCQLRRRALGTGMALLVGSIPLLGAFIVVEAANLVYIAALLLFGKRGIDYDALRHPFTYTPKSIGSSLEPSVWTYKKGEKRKFRGFRSTQYEYEARHSVFAVINPVTVLFFTAIGFGLYLFSGVLTWLIIGACMAFVLGLLVLVISALSKGPWSNFLAEFRKRTEEAEAAEQKRKDEEFDKELEQLACSSANREVKVSALPRNRRTVRLRAQSWKAKVCRPFAS